MPVFRSRPSGDCETHSNLLQEMNESGSATVGSNTIGSEIGYETGSETTGIGGKASTDIRSRTARCATISAEYGFRSVGGCFSPFGRRGIARV